MDNMDKYCVRGVKKLFSLCSTKIRLAEEAGSVETRPSPLHLVKLLAGVGVADVSGAKAHVAGLKSGLDFSRPRDVASTVFQLLDIIEGVKWKFEPPEAFSLTSRGELEEIELECRGGNAPLNLLILCRDVPEGVSLFVGDNPPEGVHHLGRVVSNAAFFLDYAFSSKYFSDELKLRNVVAYSSGNNTLASAVHSSINGYLT